MSKNPTGITQIRAAGTPMPGKKQDKKPSKAQAQKKSKNDLILERLAKVEQGLMQLSQVLQNHEQQVRIGGLERHVALNLLEQQMGREVIESLMQQRAPHFGLQISFDEQGDNDDQNDTDESSKGNASVPADEDYEGTEEYS